MTQKELIGKLANKLQWDESNSSDFLETISNILNEQLSENNIIYIDNRFISQEEIEDTDMQEFFLDGTKLKAGDELSILTKSKEKFKGILLGAVKKEQSIKIITYANEIIKLKIESINEFKIMSKYGKFFS